MATSSPGITEEENNNIRIFYLLYRVSPSVVREIFDRQFPPGGLKTELCTSKSKEILPLFNKRVIHQKQLDLLYPVTGNPLSTTFDLTLMIVLIRNLTLIRISDVVPHSSNVTEGADLSRLKYYRNQVAHNDSGTLADTQFQKWWNDITQAILRLGGNRYQQQCDDIKEKSFGNSDKELLIEFRNIEKTNDPIPKGLKDVNCKTIKEWEDLDVIVFETRAMKWLIKMIAEEDIVTVIGSPGCGKTTAIHHVALKLYKEQLYDIIPAVYPSDIRDYYNPERNQVFVFDDMCGKYSVHVQTMHDWNDLSHCIHKIIDDKHVKILLSCRSYIFHQFRNVKLLTNTTCDFLSSDNVLTVSERRGIAKFHLTENETKIIQQDMAVFEQFDFFPLLCQLYGRHNTGDIMKFFTSPVSVIKDDLKCLMGEENQITFATLGLLVIYNNEIEDDMLVNKKPLKTTLKEMSGEFRIPYAFSPKKVKEQLDNLTKSYAKKNGSCYSIIHDKLFDILVSFFGEHLFDLLIVLCHSDVLRERFHLDTIQGDRDECLIIVPDGKHDLYFERLCYHFVNGNMDVLLSNRQMQYESYRIKIIELLKNNAHVREVCVSSAQGERYPLFTIIKQGYADVLKVLIDLKYDIHTPGKRQMAPLYCASLLGYTEIVELLLNNKADPNICHEGTTVLFYASFRGQTEIVKLLLNNKADPNICYKGESALCVVTRRGQTEIVELLLNNKADPNMCFIGRSILYIASIRGHTEIVKLLLNNKADPNICYEKKLPLYVASKKGYFEIVKLLLKSGAKITSDTKSPLYVSVKVGNTDIVSILLENNCFDLSQCDTFDQSPLFIASSNGDRQIVELLLEYNFNPNICNINGVSPLFMASKRGHVEIVKLLLKNGSYPKMCDKYGQSPLFIASRNRHLTVVELLLQYDSDPLLCNINGFSSITVALLNTRRKINEQIVTLLLKHCVKLSRITENECSFLIAVLHGDTSALDDIADTVLHRENIALDDIEDTALHGDSRDLDHIEDTVLHGDSRDLDHIEDTVLHGDSRDLDDIEDTVLHGDSRDLDEIEDNILHGDSRDLDDIEDTVLHGDSRTLDDIEDTVLHGDSRALDDIEDNAMFSKLLISGYVSPLFVATCCNNVTLVEMLLKQTGNEDGLCNTSLIAACMYGYQEIVMLLLEYGCDPNGSTEIRPLCSATEYGHTHVAELLLKYNSDPDLCDKNNMSPLFIATSFNYSEIAKLLMEKNCDVNLSCRDTKTPLYIASLHNHIKIVELLLEYKCNTDICTTNNESPLLVASQMNHREIVKLLLESKCDPAICNIYNESSLGVAIQEGHLDVVKLLLEYNCDTTWSKNKDTDHGSPLFLSLERLNVLARLDVPRRLNTYRSNQYEVVAHLNTFRCLTTHRSYQHEVVELLLHNKCDPNICNKDGQSPLHVAVEHRYRKVILLLLQANANPNVQDKEGRTPLHIASESDDTEVYDTETVKLLLEHGANPDIYDNEHCTPLLIASIHGHMDIIKLLLQYNCDPYICNNDNELPWLVAYQWGHEDIGDLLVNSCIHYYQ